MNLRQKCALFSKQATVGVGCRILQQLSDAFEPLPPAARPAHFAPQSVTDIAARNSRLADSVRFRLVGAVRLYPALYNTPTPNVMTPAEQMALQVKWSCFVGTKSGYLSTSVGLS